MANEPVRNDEMRNIWQSQKGEEMQVSIDAIRVKASKYGRTVEWRNAREYVAALAVAVFFGYSFFRTSDVLMRLGFGLLIAAMLYVCWHLHVHGSWRQLPEDLGRANCLQFHRSELERQRDLLRGVWRWYLGPMIPGLLVLMAAIARANPGHLKQFGWFVGGYDILVALVFLFIWRLNERAACHLQQRIDELDQLRADAD